jgi:hypothetical protein
VYELERYLAWMILDFKRLRQACLFQFVNSWSKSYPYTRYDT